MYDKMIGIRLDGRYEITEKIGVGGMSDVYKGKDMMEGRTVAVKILKSEYTQNEEFVRCFRNESKAIAVLSHPNIVKIFDVGHEKNLEYIVMEYIDGITLKEYIQDLGLVPWRECVHYTIQILRALQLAHDRGIVHRDIKPQNVMRLSDGTIKVMDFGIARFSRQTSANSNEKTMGSVHYVSPEQARGEHTDERSDIYSIGVMMYEMLTGRKPFDGETAVEVALKHMNEEPVKPSEYVSTMYKGLEEIILRAMEKDPEQRYQSASGMILDIEAFKNDQSVVFGYFAQVSKKQDKVFKRASVKKKQKKVKKESAEEELPIVEETVQEEQENGFDYEEEEEQRHNYILPILAATTVTAMIVATLFLSNVILGAFKTPASSSNDYTMPKLIGMNYYDARAQYPNIQLVASEEFNAEYTSGVIIGQEKAEGRIVKIGDVIRVVVSKGTRLVTVPDVVNYHYNSASAALSGESLSVLRIETESDDIAAGYIVKTDPAAYSVVDEGTTVKVYVSIGPSTEDTVVPYLVGESVSVAEDMLTSAYLVPKIQYIESSDPADVVVSQNIVEGEIVTRNTIVTIYVSDGSGVSSDPLDDDVDLSGEDVHGPGDDPFADDPFEDEPFDDWNNNGNGTVVVRLDIPASAQVTYRVTMKNTADGSEVSDDIFFNAANYAGSYIEIPVRGSGQMTISASLKSPRTGMITECAQFEVDFDNGTYIRTNYSTYSFTIVELRSGF